MAMLNYGDCGRLTNPGKWQEVIPADLFAALSKWTEAQGFDLTHYRWLAGQSGSYVALVQIEPVHGTIRGAVLKLLPPEQGVKESRGVSLAEQHSPTDFYLAHMVHTAVITALPESRWWLHLQETAYGDLTEIHLLAELVDDPRFPEFCQIITATVINEWNDGGADPKPFKTAIADFLSDDLAQKMPALKEFADIARLDLQRPERAVQIPGRPDLLPSPLALVRGTVGAGSEVRVFTGNGHGDLHPRNVVIPAGDTIDARAFRLIDSGRFSPAMPVSRDPVKLLLSISQLWLTDLKPQSRLRSSLAELVVKPHLFPPSAPVAGYLDLAKRVHAAAAQWGKRRHLSEAWACQHLLVLAASALRTVARPELDIDTRWWYFEVAAIATRELLKATAGPNTPLQATSSIAQGDDIDGVFIPFYDETPITT